MGNGNVGIQRAAVVGDPCVLCEAGVPRPTNGRRRWHQPRAAERIWAFGGVVPQNNSSTVTTAGRRACPSRPGCAALVRGTPKYTRGGCGPQPEFKPASHFKSATQNSLFAISRSQRLWGMDASRARRWAQERDTWREGRSGWASARRGSLGTWSIPHDGAVSWAGSQIRPRR